MAKKKAMAAKACPTSGGCCSAMGWVILILGLLMLARDLGWNNWLGSVSAWTLVFLVLGIYKVWMSSSK